MTHLHTVRQVLRIAREHALPASGARLPNSVQMAGERCVKLQGLVAGALRLLEVRFTASGGRAHDEMHVRFVRRERDLLDHRQLGQMRRRLAGVQRHQRNGRHFALLQAVEAVHANVSTDGVVDLLDGFWEQAVLDAIEGVQRVRVTRQLWRAGAVCPQKLQTFQRFQRLSLAFLHAHRADSACRARQRVIKRQAEEVSTLGVGRHEALKLFVAGDVSSIRIRLCVGVFSVPSCGIGMASGRHAWPVLGKQRRFREHQVLHSAKAGLLHVMIRVGV